MYLTYQKFMVILMIFFSLEVNSQVKTCTVADFHKFEWIIGDWQFQKDTIIDNEYWAKQDDSTYIGLNHYNYKPASADEHIRLLYRNQKIIYETTFKSKKGDIVTEFMLKQDLFDKWVFENLSHDFPQQIIYEKGVLNTMTASISGMRNGKKRHVKFPIFNRIEKH